MKEELPWVFISKVTPREAWPEVKASLGLGLGLLVFGGVFWVVDFVVGELSPFGSHSGMSAFFKAIPNWVYTALVIGLVLWFAKGETIKLPMMDFKLWLIIEVSLTGALAAVALLPWWLAVPVMLMALLPLHLLDRLTELGREKATMEIG